MDNLKLFDVCDKQTTRKQKLHDLFITFGLCTLCIGLSFIISFTVKIPSPFLMESVDVYGEMTDPSVVRMILAIADIIMILVFFIFAVKKNKKNQLYTSTFLSYMTGTILWQLIGECIWHFGAYRIETIQALPIAILICILIIYCNKKNAFSWPVLVMIIAFMSNWFGHLCLFGPAQLLSDYLPTQTSYIIFGCIFCISFLLYCLYRFIFRSSTKFQRMLNSMGIFISLATLIIAFVEGLK